MNDHLADVGRLSAASLPLATRLHTAWSTGCERLVAAWRERADEKGLDEAVTKMIWLAVGIVVALAATSFFVSTFNQAKNTVPDPVAP